MRIIIAGYAATALTGFACVGDINTFSTFTHLKRVMNQKYPNWKWIPFQEWA